MRSFGFAAALCALLSAPALAQQEFPATLAGHVVMPALSLVPAPADAPADLKVAGKYVSGVRVEAIGSVPGLSGGRPTGISLPFDGQALQGHSGIKRMADGTFWVIADNGFGTKLNSPDAMLFMSRYRMNWDKGEVERLETTFFRDPDKKVPFRIVHEGTKERYLTGADFDVEGLQIIGDKVWIGDEFGPFLVRLDKSGKVEAVFDTLIDGKIVRSPDHPAIAAANPGATTAGVVVRRSKGFEGLAASPDGERLYGLLEGAIWDEAAKDVEKRDGKPVLRILEFSTKAEAWTGRSWFYPLEPGATSIGDFNMIDSTTALVIERDDGEGTSDKACPEGQKRPDCFHDVAKFKRVVKIEMTDADAGRAVRKIGYVDLMKIADPNKKARKPLTDGKLAFPFFTIENVEVVDATHIIVGNDNNLPFSSSRDPQKADDDEFVLLETGDLLKAK
jgi:hypothetical protein